MKTQTIAKEKIIEAPHTSKGQLQKIKPSEQNNEASAEEAKESKQVEVVKSKQKRILY